ncbi:hypothetical protein LV716_03320 [Flagellimonas sp. HMM57]|uniref:hypothetical protein n=1 Tax=unclassified Flagellimonas TaxID=2644544 RepID=UPI0013D2C4BC|nr:MULTISPECIES: hypothetical protein [unclassified Flagellimonas]UII76834.1 hypothetical protein LV716_03320 [Flagellimonas sp. HMM57]
MSKLEKHIKEKLEERKISPSPDAWDKISTQLTINKKVKRKVWYPYAVAASLVGIVLASLFFFNSEKPEQYPNQVVNETNAKEMVVPSQNENNGLQEIQLEKPDAIAVSDKDKRKDQQLSEQAEINVASEQVKLVEETLPKTLQDSFLEKSNGLIAQKVNEVVDRVAYLETVNTEVSDEEIDSLLRTAQRQILSEQLFTEDGTVDAIALLTEVEDELDGTFRDQIFDALKEGYFKLRTAVADRNN